MTKEFLDITVIALSKKNKAKKDNLISRTEKVVVDVFSKRLKKYIKEVIDENIFGFQKGKGTRDAIVLIRITYIRKCAYIRKDICFCLIDWQKAFDHIDWMKMFEILQDIGVNWREN